MTSDFIEKSHKIWHLKIFYPFRSSVLSHNDCHSVRFSIGMVSTEVESAPSKLDVWLTFDVGVPFMGCDYS